MAIGGQGVAMGLAKSMLGDRHRPQVTAPSSKEGLMVPIGGSLECIPIRKWAGKGAKLHSCRNGFRVMVENGNYFAVAIKPKTKAQPREVEKPIKLDALGERLTQWFNFGSHAIVNTGDGWKTLEHRISPTKIVELWKDPTTAIGLRFGKTTRYGLIDLDTTGHHHNEADLRAACEALETIGIYEPFPIQSSKSGGWHLLYGVPQDVPSFPLSCAVSDVLARFGFDISPGNCEIFPNRKGWTKGDTTHYNGARLPLQPGSGSALLDNDLVPYSTSLETFLDRLEESAAACDIDLLLESCAQARANYSPWAKPNGFAPRSKLASQWRKSDLDTIAQPWEPGDSNTRLGVIARYGVVFERLTGDDLVNYIVQTAIATPDYSKHCRHQGEIEAWASRWGRCAEKKYYAYEPKKQTKPTGPSNDERKQAAMERLIEAMADLTNTARLPDGVKARERLLVNLVGISKGTLWKPDYLELWHPRFDAVAPCTHGDRHPLPEMPQSHTAQGSPTPLDKNCVGSSFVLPFPFTLSSSPSKPPEASTTASCTIPGARQKTKTTQTHTQQGIEAFSEQKTVPIKPRLAIVKNSQPQTQQGTQPPSRIVNRPKLAIADPNPLGWKPGDLVVEMTRPDLLLRVESIDLDGEWCRCRCLLWKGIEVCLLSELREPVAHLLEEVALA